MEVAKIPQKYRDRFIEMMMSDSDTLHFLWCPEDKAVITVGRDFFPEQTDDPFDFLAENGFVAEESLPLFSVFNSKIQDAIINGTDRQYACIDAKMRMDPDEAFTLHRVYALFRRDENGRVTDIHVNIRPYTERAAFDRQVVSTFTSDKKPVLFDNLITDMIKRNPDKQIAFIQFDVERFKLINDTYGTETGDRLLRFFSETLGVICGSDKPYCRLTADVFMIVMPFSERQEILDFVHMIESMLSGFNGMEYRLIFGIAIADDKSLHNRRNGDNATIARRSVKGSALNNICFYDGGMKTELHHRQFIEEEMHKALLDNEYAMYLQPKYCISTGRIIGAEALARWIHPTRGMISPDEFIPIFEENGFILKLDSVIWESACKKIRAWLDAGLEPVPISVNVSRQYLTEYDVAGAVGALIKKYDIPIRLLELEITESLDAPGVDEVISSIKEAGFTILMDDFGSGYSSLNMLKTTQFDVLKIDRSFLSEFMESDRGRKIIHHTISMSRDIGLDIIAEGVETLDQAKFLNSCGCDAAQGFYYSRPIPAEDFDEKFKADRNMA